MMSIDVPNGQAFLFERTVEDDGRSLWKQGELPVHILAKTAPPITRPPALAARSAAS